MSSTSTNRQTGINEPLIHEVLGFIDMNRERWDQATYLNVGECGTTGCFAGWAAVLGCGIEVGQVDDDIVEKVNTHRKLSISRMLGLTYDQFARIYGFVDIPVINIDGETTGFRPPTFEELCDRVFEVTGVRYKNGEAL